jgi:hypothetical protein
MAYPNMPLQTRGRNGQNEEPYFIESVEKIFFGHIAWTPTLPSTTG